MLMCIDFYAVEHCYDYSLVPICPQNFLVHSALNSANLIKNPSAVTFVTSGKTLELYKTNLNIKPLENQTIYTFVITAIFSPFTIHQMSNFLMKCFLATINQFLTS